MFNIRTASPTVMREDGYRLYFYMEEGDLPHVHVQYGDFDASFWLEPDVHDKKVPSGIPRSVVRKMQRLAKKHRSAVLAEWHLRVGEATFTKSHSIVLPISNDGFVLVVDGIDYEITFERYPDFRHAVVDEILNVERIGLTHFYWPDLDVDISLKALQNPAAYPNRYRR